MFRRLLVLTAMVGLAACASPAETEDDSSSSEAAATTTPAALQHSDDDTPAPGWGSAVRAWEGDSSVVHASVVRMLGGKESDAQARFEAWPVTIRRGFVLLVDKLTNEGLLEGIDHLEGDPWDSAFHFWSRDTKYGSLEQIVEQKTKSGVYIENSISNGVPAYFNSYNHRDWRRGWAETDVRHAALHIGIFADNKWEVHMELYNPMFIKGAPFLEVVGVPIIGYLNAPMFYMHQKWEAGAEGKNRTSANYWHFLHDSGFPLSF